MSATSGNGGPGRATQSLTALRAILEGAKTAEGSERVYAALIDVVDGLITHAEKQARAIEDLRSDVSHKQGIVSSIGRSDVSASKPPAIKSVDANDNDQPDS